MRKNGFTLVELLAVIVVLALIMVIAIPAVLNTKETASKVLSADEERSIKDAAKLLAIDLDDPNSSLFNCGSGNNWLNCKLDSERTTATGIKTKDWLSATVTVEELIKHNYFSDNKDNGHCKGQVTIKKSGTDHIIELSKETTCK